LNDQEKKDLEEEKEKSKHLQSLKSALKLIETSYKRLAAMGAMNEAAYLKKSINELKKAIRSL
jgi:hypothetical protein